MGTSESVPELVGKLERFAATQKQVERNAVRAATVAVKASIDGELAAATGGKRRLSGVGKKGANLRVRTAVSADKSVTTATGPWQLIERDTKRHDISPRGLRTGKRGRRLKGAKALTFGGGFYASAKNTGGSQGKEPWAKGTLAGAPLAAKAFDAAETAAIREVFH